MRIVLEQRQMLNMVMTTELRQAIELLQMSTFELSQFIQKQAEENPFIELVEKQDTPSDIKRTQTSGEGLSPIDFAATKGKTLHDQLMEQLVDYSFTTTEYSLIKYLILNIDEHGYLTISDKEICQQCNVSMEEVKQIKKILHGLEPVGIGANSLAQCLLLQAKKEYPDDQLLMTMIKEYLPQLADKKWAQIAKELNISLAKVNDLFQVIQTFNPRPAAHLSTPATDYVSPDIFIEKSSIANSFSVSLNDYYLPEIRYNYGYSNEFKKTKELSFYIENQFKKFEWLKKSIEQRRITILKIMEVIVRKQREYLEKGLPSALNALTLKDVADEIDMHESTVSRATANKTVQTPVGTFELRDLFSTRLSTRNKTNTSQTKVKALLKEVIDKEDKFSPLSDQKIADFLKEERGIIISRRTVAKYRDELHIPPSSKRKEIKII